MNTTNENKNEAAEIEVYPELQSKPMPVLWNYETIEHALRAALEKYRGLIVTDENLKDMEKAHREIVSYRTQLERFKKRVRAEYDKPKNEFTDRCNKLLNIVAQVEAPIRTQLDEYETRRTDTLKETIHATFFEMANRAGIASDFATLDFKDKWLNRTQKWKDTVSDLAVQVADCYRAQTTKRQLDELTALRREILEQFIASKNAELNLARPIKLEHIRADILSMNSAEARAVVNEVAEHEAQYEAEVRARMAEHERQAEPEPKPAPVAAARPKFIGAVGAAHVDGNLFTEPAKPAFRPKVYHIHAIVRTIDEENELIAATNKLREALVTSEELNENGGNQK